MPGSAPGVEFRPGSLGDRAVARQGVASIDEARPFVRACGRPFAFLGALALLTMLGREDGLKGGGRQRPHQLDQVRAALDPSDELLNLAVEAGPDAQSDQALEIGRDLRAEPVRAGV